MFWPGDHRAGEVCSDRAFVAAMVAVESAWVGVELTVPEVAALGGDVDPEAGGNPLIALLPLLRAAHPHLELHTGLTSQDVVDTAVVLMMRDAAAVVRRHLARAVAAVDDLVSRHGDVVLDGRTLTQPALPVTVGHRLAGWQRGLSEAGEELSALRWPAQCGGPVGTLRDARLAERLGLDDVPAWHTHRRPVTRIGDTLVAAVDACGHVARDVLEGSRLGELSEGRGGGSSSMPHKHNPVLAVLVRRAALTAPQLGATLHLGAADQVEERADGAWHAEWDTLRLLARRAVVAAAQTADLLEGLRVHPGEAAR
nr:lyase family protein [Nocardioides flavescens]